MMMSSSPEKTVDPPTPRMDFMPNIAATFVPMDESEVQALLMMMSTTYTGSKNRKPATSTLRTLEKKAFICLGETYCFSVGSLLRI
jgi:hypothetical protein